MGLSWYIKRLRAMSASEVIWRLGQEHLSARERKSFTQRTPVFEVGAYGLAAKADLTRLGINFSNDSYSVGAEIELLGGYSYAEYRKRWHAAFQTPGDWPMRFAPDYAFGDEDVPGDIRTNWELNRHYQFAVLAKSYFVTGDDAYLAELTDLFVDWNDKNPFMWGPEWSSPMEESIRLVNWLVAAAFLEASKSPATAKLLESLCSGAWTMAAHVRGHYSRHSSANNHTIIEAAGVAIAAAVFGQRQWLNEALALLESEVALQTYADGVNKEQALHYELFVMEALCLVAHALSAAGESLPEPLKEQLRLMVRYARACNAGGDKYIEFGDDDEGIILNLAQNKPCYPEYVLALATLELGDNYRWVEDVRRCETLRWLYSCNCLDAAALLPLAANKSVENFPEGGVTIVRFDDDRAVLAFDHGPLGFGQLAAHGHADALSVQLFVDGEPVLIDPGTYVYNGNREMRDRFRSTCAHNTVCIGERDQSEALGPFLWGHKADVSGFALEEREDCIRMLAEHDGYAPAHVRRTIETSVSEVVITDETDGGETAMAYLHFPFASIETLDGDAEILLDSGTTVRVEMDAPMGKTTFRYSPAYGVLADGMETNARVNGRLVTTISVLRGAQRAASGL